MASMVEKVARAMRRRRYERNGRIGVYDPDLPVAMNELDDACAAIEAMRNPTSEMTIAAHVRLENLGQPTDSELDVAYEAMINAALSEDM